MGNEEAGRLRIYLCIAENACAFLGEGNIDVCGYFRFSHYAFFYFGTDVFAGFRRKEARDHVSIFLQDAEKDVLCLDGHAAVIGH